MDTLTFLNLLSKLVKISWNISGADETPSLLQEYLPHGVANVNIFCVLSDSFICQNPFVQSNSAKSFEPFMSAVNSSIYI